MINTANEMIKSLKSGQFSGVMLWEGSSLYDGAPIMCIATGIDNASDNDKTGDMVQTWIIRADIEPHIAVKNGDDVSICGPCKYRSGEGCYVTVHHAPLSVYRAFHRGRYARPGIDFCQSIIPELFRARMVRIGSYGDPAAMPNIWDAVLRYAAGFTGYTHGWRVRPDLMLYCMASVDASDYHEAKSIGWRTFRVRQSVADRMPNEANCGASAEVGKVTNCAACFMCSGLWHKSNRDIAINAHGIKAGRIVA